MSKIQALLSWRKAIAESELESTTRLVAFGLSMWMSEMGENAYPGPTTLAKATGLSVRSVKTHLAVLESQGWLTVTERGGIKGEARRANCYRAAIPVQPVTRAGDSPVPVQEVTRAPVAPVQETTPTRASDDTPPVQEVHPNSSLELSKNSPTTPSGANAVEVVSNGARRRNLIWDAVVEEVGSPRTVSEKKLVGKIVSELVEADATPDEIHTVAGRYRSRWKVDLTPTALTKWFTHFLESRPPKSASDAAVDDWFAMSKRAGLA